MVNAMDKIDRIGTIIDFKSKPTINKTPPQVTPMIVGKRSFIVFTVAWTSHGNPYK